MATIWERAISILAGNLNSGHSYLITAVHLESELELKKQYCEHWWHTGVLSNSRASDNQRNFSCLSGQAYNLELHNKFPKRFLFFFAVSISYHFTCTINYYSFCFCCRKNEIVKQLFVFPQERISCFLFQWILFEKWTFCSSLYILWHLFYYILPNSKWLPWNNLNS